MLRRLIGNAIDAGDAFRIRSDALLDNVLPDVGDRRAKSSAFWVLLTCSAVIATAGVLSDSTAVVIGAMVIAPLGTPIYGVSAALATGIRVRPALMRVLGGVLLAIAIGAVVDLVILERFATDANPQILSRTSPSLLDLWVALATGIAGSMALVRTDISPALPGVAIAISLVPPLTVVGITLVNGEFGMAFGAFTLFATNMFAILVAGLVVFSGARLEAPFSADLVRTRRARRSLWIGGVAIVLLLGAGTTQAVRLTIEERDVRRAAERYADAHEAWTLTSVERQGTSLVVSFVGDGTRAAPAVRADSPAFASIRSAGSKVVVHFDRGATVQLE